jgi:hypothetical protein
MGKEKGNRIRKEYEKERLRRDEEEGCRTHISVFNRMCDWDVTFYEIELELRKRRALNEGIPGHAGNCHRRILGRGGRIQFDLSQIFAGRETLRKALGEGARPRR